MTRILNGAQGDRGLDSGTFDAVCLFTISEAEGEGIMNYKKILGSRTFSY